MNRKQLMHKCLIFLIIQILSQTISYTQNPKYKQLLDSFTDHIGLFVAKKPINDIRVSLSDTSLYDDYVKERYHYKLDKNVLIQLIENSKSIDSSNWLDNELEKSILLNRWEESVNMNYALTKLKITNKKQIKLYRKRVQEFNNKSSWDKDIYYISRPVFDNTNQFALIQYDNGHSGLGGGGSVALFHFEGDIWKEIGAIEDWRY